MSLSALRAGVLHTVARASAAPVRRTAFLPAAAALPRFAAVAAAVRPLHSSACRCGGHGGDDGPFTHGTDFLPRAAVERRVKQVLSDVEKIDKTKLDDPNSTFRELGLDSLDEVEAVMLLEDEFCIDIQDEVASTILSPLDAINYICQHPFAVADRLDDDHHH